MNSHKDEATGVVILVTIVVHGPAYTRGVLKVSAVTG